MQNENRLGYTILLKTEFLDCSCSITEYPFVFFKFNDHKRIKVNMAPKMSWLMFAIRLDLITHFPYLMWSAKKVTKPFVRSLHFHQSPLDVQVTPFKSLGQIICMIKHVLWKFLKNLSRKCFQDKNIKHKNCPKIIIMGLTLIKLNSICWLFWALFCK